MASMNFRRSSTFPTIIRLIQFYSINKIFLNKNFWKILRKYININIFVKNKKKIRCKIYIRFFFKISNLLKRKIKVIFLNLEENIPVSGIRRL